jgi:hypothetical protein
MEKMLITKSFDAFTKAVKSLHGELSATPERVVKEMFSKLDKVDWKNPNLKILDPAAGFGTFLRESYIRLKEFHTEEHILNNMLYACEINGFKTLFLEKKMGLRNIYKGDFLTMKLPESWPKKFNIGLSNPPYGDKTDTTLQMRFLYECINICEDRIVFVHPSTHFLSPRDLLSKTNITTKIIESLEFFNGNSIFDINKYYYLSITSIDLKKESEEFQYKFRETGESGSSTEFSKITHLGCSEELLDLRKNYKKWTGEFNMNKKLSVRKGGKKPSEGKYIVPISGTRGHVNREGKIHKEDYFTPVSKDTRVFRFEEGSEVPYHWFEFETEREAINFLSFLKTDFLRMGYAFYKFNNANNGCFKLIPNIDFTQEWTDKKLYKNFGVTKKQQELIKEIIPSYYD